MHVVQQHDNRLFSCEVGQDDGECLADVRRWDVHPPRPVKPGRSSKNTAEVGDIPAAQAHHLVVRAVPQVAVEELCPEPKWCGRAREVTACPQGENATEAALHEIRGKPGLADPRLSVDHDAPKRTLLGRAQGECKGALLCVPADERNWMGVLDRHLPESMADDHSGPAPGFLY